MIQSRAVVKPKVRGFICITAHPVGCEAHVQEQIEAVLKWFPSSKEGPKKVLIIGASTGYGLASRITAAFGYKAQTLGVFFERPCQNGKPASAGWYNTVAFEKAALKQSLYCKSINGDAFSNEIKEITINTIKEDLGKVDLVIYSLASPKRIDPKDGRVYKSTLKPIGQRFKAKTVDTDKKVIHEIEIEAASEEEIADTQKVMGGEDWELWMEA
jgi:enoyl-[acyl-carrier protein] reductase / trans-2-enoyl-CoA reductase (NAD+)